MKTAWIVVACALVLSLARIEDAKACSCVGPHDVLVGPDRAADVALNTKVRLEVPAGTKRANGAVLRVHEGDKVDASVRTFADGSLTFVELTPGKPLSSKTRYEIAIVDPADYPSTTVIGTFETGTTTDTTPPKLDSIGTAVARGNAHPGGGDCSIRGPWIDIGPIRAEDPGRPNAKLLFAVWLADASGNIDVAKPPLVLVAPHKETVTLGKRSLCDPHGFPVPSAQAVSLAIAAVDEAGNTSAAKRVRVDLRGVWGSP
jgi:hypothetical protein